jgi:hypothetical protein
VVSEAQQVLPDSDVSPIQKQVDNIKSAIKDGVLSGEGYQALTRRNSPLDRATESANPTSALRPGTEGHAGRCAGRRATPENAQALEPGQVAVQEPDDRQEPRRQGRGLAARFRRPCCMAR